MTTYEITQSTDGVIIENVTRGYFDEPSIEFRPPRFQIEVASPGGIEAYSLAVGKEIEIRRSGELVFTGVIDTSVPKRGGGGPTTVVASGVHKGYKLLSQHLCDTYDFDEDGDPITTRDAVTVNPWRYFIFRNSDGSLDANGNLDAVDGITPDEIMESLIGSKFAYQHDYQDRSHLLASQFTAGGTGLDVYRDSLDGDTRPALQLARQPSGYEVIGTAESIPLENGDPNIEVMGNITEAEVLIIGEKAGTIDPTIELCRNARDTRVYSSVGLTHTANYLGSGLDAWSGSLTFADAPANKNSLGYKVEIDSTKTGSSYGVLMNDFTIAKTDRRGVFYEKTTPYHTGPSNELIGSPSFDAWDQNNFFVTHNHLINGLTLYYSTNGGATWGSFVLDTPAATGRTVTKAKSSTRVYILASQGTALVSYEANLAVPELVSGPVTIDAANSPATLGGLSISTNGAFGVCTFYTSNADGKLRFSRSSDGGQSWSSPVHVDTQASRTSRDPSTQSIHAFGGGTTYLAVYTTFGPLSGDFRTWYIVVAKSTDSGATWAHTELFSISVNEVDVGNTISLNPAIVGESTNNAYISFFSGNNITGFYSAHFATTTDSGSTWSTKSVGYPRNAQKVAMVREGNGIFTLLDHVAGGHMRTDTITGTGDTWYHGTFNFNDGSAPKESADGGPYVSLLQAGNWPDATDTTKIRYIKVIATTTPDTGITAGSIAAYSNPVTFTDGAEDWIETDLSTKTRLEGIEHIRKLTESDVAVNASPHWDAWVDNSFAFNFAERRGALKPHTLSFAEETLDVIEHEFYGGELAYQTIIYGAGSGFAQTRIVSKADFTTGGGLYDATRDPAVGALYGEAARVMRFVDSNEKSITTLFRKGRAFHKLHRDPKESYQVRVMPEHIRFYGVGDSVNVTDYPTRSTEAVRVVDLRRSFTGNSEEKVTLELGEKMLTMFDTPVSLRDSQNEIVVHAGKTPAINTVTAANVFATISNPGKYVFNIPDGAVVERVLLDIRTVPWTAPLYTTSEESGTHTHQLIHGQSIFRGDDLDAGNLDPVYGGGITFYVDDPDSIYSGSIGNFNSEVAITADITGLLAVDANGVIQSGPHVVVFEPSAFRASTRGNEQGLAALAVSPDLKFRSDVT